MSIYKKNTYIDNNHNEYQNVRDIHYEKKEDLFGNLGKLIAETEYKDNPFLSSSWNLNNGIYLYQSKYNDDTALRIYKDFADYLYTIHNDAQLIYNLQKQQENIKLTQFPTGVVTVENHIIGQEVPYFKDSKTLAEKSLITKNKKQLLEYYSQIIKILKELHKEGIVYADVRSRNFMINNTDDHINLIDFENQYISFDGKRYYQDMINNLKIMINEINTYLGINFNLDKEENLENIEYTVTKHQHSNK